jgi:hypothetical protein
MEWVIAVLVGVTTAVIVGLVGYTITGRREG